MKKVLCLIYPNFSLYEVVSLTSTLALSFGVEIDYAGSDRNVIRSEDGLACQPTRTLDEVVIEDYSCVILPGMINIAPALHDEKLISFLKNYYLASFSQHLVVNIYEGNLSPSQISCPQMLDFESLPISACRAHDW